MKWAFVGHRGVGKTTLLNHLKSKLTDYECIDLDSYIEKKTKKSISEIFQFEGESEFRRLEEEHFVNATSGKENCIISLGAGFRAQIPADFKVVWLRRATDLSARVFLNRPRLNTLKLPSEEYLERIEARESNYESTSDLCINLPEGLDNASDLFLRLSGFEKLSLDPFSITLTEEYLGNDVEAHIKRFLGLGVRYIELRNDLLNEARLIEVAELIPKENLLISFRAPSKTLITWAKKQKLNYDWALELGKPALSAPGIISVHDVTEADDEFYSELEKYQKKGFHIKVSPLVMDFQSLYRWHTWQSESLAKRSFLPRSTTGRWNWYRQVFGLSQRIHFVKELAGSAMDQPTLSDHYFAVKDPVGFAAVIGKPVHHSRTPMHHNDFFAEKSVPVVGIEVSDEELNLEVIEVLKNLKAVFLAITSPLKEKFYEVLRNQPNVTLSSKAEGLKSVNTLVHLHNKVHLTNTDEQGLRDLLKDLDSKESIVLWGGGGTVSSIQSVLPEVIRFSARTGKGESEVSSPDTIIWAVGRSRMEGCMWPHSSWRPKRVIDLNYTDDSPGKEYALLCGAEYVSGVSMFQSQAQAQRDFYQMKS